MNAIDFALNISIWDISCYSTKYLLSWINNGAVLRHLTGNANFSDQCLAFSAVCSSGWSHIEESFWRVSIWTLELENDFENVIDTVTGKCQIYNLVINSDTFSSWPYLSLNLYAIDGSLSPYSNIVPDINKCKYMCHFLLHFTKQSGIASFFWGGKDC